MKVEALFQSLPDYYTPQEVEQVRAAYEFANEAHEGQKRLSGEPYINHCLAVAQILAELHVPHTVVMAGLLHDTAEDTDVSIEDLQELFGAEVGLLVDGVTKLDSLPRVSRSDKEFDETDDPNVQELIRERERSRKAALAQETLRKTFLAMSEDVRVVLIKLADRLHNMRTRGHQGYVDDDGMPRLNILEVQRLIRFMPKVVIAVVPGWAVGGGHSLHVVCDLTLASKEHAIFKQTDADVTSFDGGYGSAYLAKMVGQKRAREIFFLGRNYSAQDAYEMGMVNAVIPHAQLEDTAYEWAQEILEKSPTSIKMLKFAFNLTDDGMVGQQVFAGEATRLAYMTDEAKEGRNAFLEKRKPNFKDIKWIP